MEKELSLKKIGTGFLLAMMAGVTNANAESISLPLARVSQSNALPSSKNLISSIQTVSLQNAFQKNSQVSAPKMNLRTLARGGETGGGGGLIVKNGKVETLPEAGIILERASDLSPASADEIYSISSSAKSELRKVIALFPFDDQTQQEFVSKILRSRGTFLSRSNVDSKEYQEIASDYAATLKAYGYNLDRSAFDLAAVSKSGKTYILPNFDRLNPQQQAMILIHEFFMRESAQDSAAWDSPRLSPEQLLPRVLEFDGQLYKLLQSSSTNSDFDFSRLMLVMRELGVLNDQTVSMVLAPEALLHRQVKFGTITLNDLVLDPNALTRVFGTSNSADINPSVLKHTSGQDEKFQQLFANAYVGYYVLVTKLISEQAKAEMTSLGGICEAYRKDESREKVDGDRVIYVSPVTKTVFALNCQEQDYMKSSGILKFGRITPTF